MFQVVAVVSGLEKVNFLRDLGVEHVIDASGLGSGERHLHKAIKAVAPKGGR